MCHSIIPKAGRDPKAKIWRLRMFRNYIKQHSFLLVSIGGPFLAVDCRRPISIEPQKWSEVVPGPSGITHVG